MTLNDFYEWLKRQPLQDKLVHMMYKYHEEDNWTEANEYLVVNIYSNSDYTWLNDWCEGQDDIVILGCIDVDEIKIPLFESDSILPSSFVNHIYSRFLFE